MHVQVVTYDPGMMGEQEYISVAHEIAPSVATVPGLHAAVWMDGAETGTYGAIFFWEDHASMERFTDGQLFASTFGQFDDVLIAHADVFENITRETQPSLQIVPGAGESAGALPAAGAGADQLSGGSRSRKAITGKRSGPTGKRAATKATTAGKKTTSAAKKVAAKAASAGKKTIGKKATGKKTASGRKTAARKPKIRAKS